MIISRKFTDLKAAKQEVCSLKDFPSSMAQGRREKYVGAPVKDPQQNQADELDALISSGS